MNAPFVKERAKQLNERIHSMDFESESSTLELVYKLVAGRPPSRNETTFAQQFIESLAESSGTEGENNSRRKDAWEQLCHGLLISNSFLFLE